MKKIHAVALVCLFSVTFLSVPARAELWEKQVLPQAEKGDPKVQYLLAQMYYNGKGAKKNVRKAVHWYEEAAANGHTGAMLDLAWIYRTGERYVKKDIDKALTYYKMAAEQDEPRALLNLAFMYDEGLQVGEDNDLAVKYYERAIDLGDDVAMYNLGALYWEGKDVEQDNKRAWTLLNRARMSGKTEELQQKAIYLLDEMKEGLHVKRPRKEQYPAWEKLEFEPVK